MECWNNGKSKIPSLAGLVLKGSFSFINILNFPVNMSFTNNPLYHFPITQYSLRGVGYEPEATIPLFHYSPRCFSGDERSELSSGIGNPFFKIGEAAPYKIAKPFYNLFKK